MACETVLRPYVFTFLNVSFSKSTKTRLFAVFSSCCTRLLERCRKQKSDGHGGHVELPGRLGDSRDASSASVVVAAASRPCVRGTRDISQAACVRACRLHAQ